MRTSPTAESSLGGASAGQSENKAAMHGSGRGRPPWAIPPEGLGPRQALIVLAAAALLFAAPRAAQPDSEDAMVREFQSYCVDYYKPTQCARAARFVLSTKGGRYFAQLHDNEAPEAFIDGLAAAVKGGDALGPDVKLSAKVEAHD
jgi:hypothetical protein